ncbi:MAG: MlaD family protein [Alphaproteobacteria bacterium]
METRASYTIIGAFVLAFAVGIIAAVVWLADIEIDSETSSYYILFDGSVTGLRPGNPVRYRGVPVGTVENMEINPGNVEQVRVTIEVPTSTPIKEDAEASLEFQGLTGVAYVQITGGTHDAPPLTAKPGQSIPVIPSTASQLEEVFEKAPELLSRFIALVDRANDLLNQGNRENLSGTLNNLNTFTGTLAQSGEDIQRLVREGGDALAQLKATAKEAETLIGAFAGRSETIAALAEQTLINVDGLVQESTQIMVKADPMITKTTETMDSVGGLVNELRPHVVPLTKDARTTMEELGKVAADLRVAAQNIGLAAKEAAVLIDDNEDSVNEFTNSGLYEFTQLLSETRVLVQALTRISKELERDPARFLFGNQNEGFQAE